MNIETAQSGLFDETSRHARLLEYCIKPSVDASVVKTVLKELIQYTQNIAGLNLNLAFGASFWDRLNPA